MKICLKEERRIRDKDKVYRIDTELDVHDMDGRAAQFKV